MGLSTGVYFPSTTTSVGMTGDLSLLVVPHFTSSPPYTPTKAPLRSSVQQNVQPSLTHPGTQPHLPGTNALRFASVDSHGSNALNCCSSSRSSTCPAITGAHATNLESRILSSSVQATSVDPLTYSIGATLIPQHYRPQHYRPQHYQLQHSMIDLLPAAAHTPVGAPVVDVTVPQPKPSCS